jgi:hypothetical protein
MSDKDLPIFSLVEGGATYQLFHLFGRRRMQRFVRVAIAAALICWLPLMIFSIVQGTAWGRQGCGAVLLRHCRLH